MSNVIAHDPRPWFVEYLRADLEKNRNPKSLANSFLFLVALATLWGNQMSSLDFYLTRAI